MPETEAFKKLKKSMMKEYFGESVPKKYQKKYGTKYNKKDVLSFAIATAKTKMIPIDIPELKKKGLYFK